MGCGNSKSVNVDENNKSNNGEDFAPLSAAARKKSLCK